MQVTELDDNFIISGFLCISSYKYKFKEKVNSQYFDANFVFRI